MKIEITNAKVALAVLIGIGMVILASTHPDLFASVLPGIVKSVLGQ
jgi:hypothetical protein